MLVILFTCLVMVSCYSPQIPPKKVAQQDSPSVETFKPRWASIVPSTVESIVRNSFEISENIAAEKEVLDLIRKNSTVLGRSLEKNALQSREQEDPSPDPVKFRTYHEIFLNACYVGMGKANILSKYFPDKNWSSESFSKFYLEHLGRKPSSQEVVVLLNLVGNLETFHLQATSTCATALNSIEFLNSR